MTDVTLVLSGQVRAVLQDDHIIFRSNTRVIVEETANQITIRTAGIVITSGSIGSTNSITSSFIGSNMTASNMQPNGLNVWTDTAGILNITGVGAGRSVRVDGQLFTISTSQTPGIAQDAPTTPEPPIRLNGRKIKSIMLSGQTGLTIQSTSSLAHQNPIIIQVSDQSTVVFSANRADKTRFSQFTLHVSDQSSILWK